MSDKSIGEVAAIRPALIPLILALVTAVGPISTDMYLPAFPAMRADLDGGLSSGSFTLAAWFGGLAVGQITHGPLSDRFGRKAPLLIGGILYTLGSAACALSTGMTALIVFRALAAFGGAAGLVVPRAVIRDIATSGIDGARIFSRLQVIMSVVPMLAPTLGGFIVETTGWRMIFWVAAAYGLASSLIVWRFLPETLPRGLRTASAAMNIVHGYAVILRERSFLLHALTGAFGTFSLFAFLGGAPAVFLRHFGMTPTWFGIMFIANAAGFALGTNLNVRALERLGQERSLTYATWALAGGSLVMLACSQNDTGGLWGIEGPMIFIMIALGSLLPDAAIGAILPHEHDAGSASALYGTMVFAIGAFGTIGSGWAASQTAQPMALIMVAGAIAALLTNLVRRRLSR
jgi:DHA1 family bicyclomycin/chloramphenicol resistance-like MFS transporter